MGIISEIFTILENVCFGNFYFKIALMLRQGLLINSVLHNSSVWYNVTQKDIKDLSQLDQIFFSRLLKLPKTAPAEAVFLETGTLDFETNIKMSRILYFHNLVNRPQNQILYAFFMKQYSKPTQGDWICQVLDDMKEFDISCSFDYMKSMSKLSFKTIVKKRAIEFAFRKYRKSKLLHSKMHNLKYDELKIQDYFTDENLSNNEKITIMRWRILCEDFGENYKGGRQSVLCPLCMGHKDGQLESFTRCDFITHRIRFRGQYE